jgi:hypothetical protein
LTPGDWGFGSVGSAVVEHDGVVGFVSFAIHDITRVPSARLPLNVVDCAMTMDDLEV